MQHHYVIELLQGEYDTATAAPTVLIPVTEKLGL